MPTLPLLVFPTPVGASREGLPNPNIPRPVLPTGARQIERLTPKFNALNQVFDTDRVEAYREALGEDPDLVLVIETIGAPDDFINAANRIPGLEWLFGSLASEFLPDTDFFYAENQDKLIGGKLFLLSTTRNALEEIERLWRLYCENPKIKLGNKINAWKAVFPLLRDIRFWGPDDRLDGDLRDRWTEKLNQGDASISFEIEAWTYRAERKNTQASAEISRLVADLGGLVVSETLMVEISYHGFLVSMPSESLGALLSSPASHLLLSERIMFFRPQGQAVCVTPDEEGGVNDGVQNAEMPNNNTPVVAVLDGLPLANHPHLAGRVIVDDPDGWSEDYPAADRVHGTKVASLIAWGDLRAQASPLTRPVYVRPIMRPDQTVERSPRPECTPSDRLLIDLIHGAVRRILVGESDNGPAAPGVKIINISVGDASRVFDGRVLSAWARLLDWLAFQFDVLFIISAGNAADDLSLSIPRETIGARGRAEQSSLATRALLSADMHRRVFSPAESINAITVGASHDDAGALESIPGRHVIFEDGGIAPYSCIGPGFRRSIKPDVLFPGGRLRYSERMDSPPESTWMKGLWNSPASPGLLAASPQLGATNTQYVRGTSFAAALATRAASRIYDVLELLRDGRDDVLPAKYDAVLIKALLVHGASWGETYNQVISAKPDVTNRGKRQRLTSRYVGYGASDINRAITCTEQRATLLGVGELLNEKAVEFRIPIPLCLHALPRGRRLTITLAWISPTNSSNSRYRVARLWVTPPVQALGLTREEADHAQVKGGTVQHEVLYGDRAMPIVDGQELVFTINCLAEAGRIFHPIKFALCATLEVEEELGLPIYREVSERISPRPQIRA